MSPKVAPTNNELQKKLQCLREIEAIRIKYTWLLN